MGPNENYLEHLVGTVRTVLGNDFIIYTTDPPPNIAKGSLAGDSVYRWQSRMSKFASQRSHAVHANPGHRESIT